MRKGHVYVRLQLIVIRECVTTSSCCGVEDHPCCRTLSSTCSWRRQRLDVSGTVSTANSCTMISKLSSTTRTWDRTWRSCMTSSSMTSGAVRSSPIEVTSHIDHWRLPLSGRHLLNIGSIHILYFLYRFSAFFARSIDNEMIFVSLKCFVITNILNISRQNCSRKPIRSFRSHSRLNYAFDGLRPTGYHVVNIVLHALATILFTHVCRKVVLLDGKFEAATAGIMFAVHPIHSEAVSIIYVTWFAAVCWRLRFLCRRIRLMLFSTGRPGRIATNFSIESTCGCSYLCWVICQSKVEMSQALANVYNRVMCLALTRIDFLKAAFS